MGTSGAYSGSGGKAGKNIGTGVGEWLDSLPGAGGDGATGDGQAGDGTSSGDGKPKVELPPMRFLRGAIHAVRPREATSLVLPVRADPR